MLSCSSKKTEFSSKSSGWFTMCEETMCVEQVDCVSPVSLMPCGIRTRCMWAEDPISCPARRSNFLRTPLLQKQQMGSPNVYASSSALFAWTPTLFQLPDTSWCCHSNQSPSLHRLLASMLVLSCWSPLHGDALDGRNAQEERAALEVALDGLSTLRVAGAAHCPLVNFVSDRAGRSCRCELRDAMAAIAVR